MNTFETKKTSVLVFLHGVRSLEPRRRSNRQSADRQENHTSENFSFSNKELTTGAEAIVTRLSLKTPLKQTHRKSRGNSHKTESQNSRRRGKSLRTPRHNSKGEARVSEPKEERHESQNSTASQSQKGGEARVSKLHGNFK